MKAVLFYESAPDVMTKAPLHYAAHKLRVDAFQARGELLAVGTWADPRDGSMAVFRTRAAAEAFAKDDPFVLNGVVARYRIQDWNEVLLGEPARAPQTAVAILARRWQSRPVPISHRSRAVLRIALPAVVALAAGAFWLLRRGDLSPEEAHRLVASGARLLDVRSHAEFAAGHLPGALNIPVQELPRRLSELEPRDRPIVVYCHTGVRATRATRSLRQAGYPAVHNLGAMARW